MGGGGGGGGGRCDVKCEANRDKEVTSCWGWFGSKLVCGQTIWSAEPASRRSLGDRFRRTRPLIGPIFMEIGQCKLSLGLWADSSLPLWEPVLHLCLDGPHFLPTHSKLSSA